MQVKVLYFDDTGKNLKESDILPDIAGQGGKILSVKSDGSKLDHRSAFREEVSW